MREVKGDVDPNLIPTVQPSEADLKQSELLYSGPGICMWKDPVKGWEFATPTVEKDFGGIFALAIGQGNKIVIKIEHDPITSADIVKLPGNEDLLRESGMELIPSVQTPASSGLTSEHNKLDFCSVKITDRTLKAGMELVGIAELPKRLSELTSNGALIDPALPAAVAWYALNRPEVFASSALETLSLSGEARDLAFSVASRDRSQDKIDFSTKFLLVRSASGEGGAQVQYAARPSNVLGAVIAPALVEDKNGERFLVLAKQYRPPVGAEVYAHTAGLIGDKDKSDGSIDIAKATEKVRATVKAELSEEVGAVSLSDELSLAFVGVSAPGLSNELHFFTPVKVRLDGVGGGAANEGEEIDRVLLPFNRQSILDFVNSNTLPKDGSQPRTVRVETSFLAGVFCLLPELLQSK